MPLIVKVLADKPVNPDKVPPVPSVRVSVAPLVLSVPLPDSVPLTLIFPPLVSFGLLPSGILQLLLTVLVPAVFVNVTRLKVTLLQLRVFEVVPLKVTVPPLALKVGEPEMVMAPLTEVVPLEAVKLPADRVKLLIDTD